MMIEDDCVEVRMANALLEFEKRYNITIDNKELDTQESEWND